MEQLWEAAEFVRKLQARMRFGKLSRASLRLLRMELRGDLAECEWTARLPDPWDADLPPSIGERKTSLQALEDSIAVRNLLFSALPGVSTAVFRVYRQADDEDAELIITGTMNRREEVADHIPSLAMRAKLCGFRFWLDDGGLGALQAEGCAVRP
jgi:hypothetical protein